ncbi:hypothetical protein MPER_10029, partial [Moniliophthora perniciosa FA553]
MEFLAAKYARNAQIVNLTIESTALITVAMRNVLNVDKQLTQATRDNILAQATVNNQSSDGGSNPTDTNIHHYTMRYLNMAQRHPHGRCPIISCRHLEAHCNKWHVSNTVSCMLNLLRSAFGTSATFLPWALSRSTSWRFTRYQPQPQHHSIPGKQFHDGCQFVSGQRTVYIARHHVARPLCTWNSEDPSLSANAEAASGGKKSRRKRPPLTKPGEDRIRPCKSNPCYGFVDGVKRGSETWEVARKAPKYEMLSSWAECNKKFNDRVQALARTAEEMADETGCWVYLACQMPAGRHEYTHYTCYRLRKEAPGAVNDLNAGRPPDVSGASQFSTQRCTSSGTRSITGPKRERGAHTVQ